MTESIGQFRLYFINLLINAVDKASYLNISNIYNIYHPFCANYHMGSRVHKIRQSLTRTLIMPLLY